MTNLKTKSQIDENLQPMLHLHRKQHFNVGLRFVGDKYVQRNDNRGGQKSCGNIGTQVYYKIEEYFHIVVKLILA